MKVIVYHEQKKITVENIMLSNTGALEDLLEENDTTEIKIHDLLSYNLQISSTHGHFDEDDIICCENLQEEKGGINWQQETVN